MVEEVVVFEFVVWVGYVVEDGFYGVGFEDGIVMEFYVLFEVNGVF